LFLSVAFALAFAGEEQSAPYPLWDGKETTEQYAKKVNLPQTLTLDLGNGVKLELVLIPAGKFIMGTAKPVEPEITALPGQIVLFCAASVILVLLAWVVLGMRRRRSWKPQYSLRWLLTFVFVMNGVSWGTIRWWQANEAWENYLTALEDDKQAYASEKPAHEVTISRPFYMGKYEVTQEQYETIIGNNPSLDEGQDLPLEMVSWDDCQTFCQKASTLTGKTVRLPMEAEWEYACRAGTTTKFYSGNDEKDLAEAAWFDGNSGNKTHPVGQKRPNNFGLYDMHGNVREWCQDWYDDYTSNAVTDPQGPASGSFRVLRAYGSFRVLRGGSWAYGSMFCRSAYRLLDTPDYPCYDYGFRVVVAGP
jgi:formylglycine-generating enzyme required for sulfatase activity